MIGLILLGAAFSYLQCELWFGKNGIYDVFQVHHALTLQNKVTDQLKKQNALLLFQIKRLKESSEAIENRARNELGMIKKDEVFYQIVGE